MKLSPSDLYALVNVKKNLDAKFLINYVGQNPEETEALLNIALSTEPLPSRNAGYVLSLIAEKDRKLILPFVKVICKVIPDLKHNSQIYCLIMCLVNAEPEIDQLDNLLDFLFQSMELSSDYGSVKYAAITYLDKLCEQEPLLVNEFVETLSYYTPRFEKKYLIEQAKKLHSKWSPLVSKA